MPTLLHIDCSPQRPSRSISRHVTAAGVEAWRRHHPEGTVIRRDLKTTPLVSIGQEWVDGIDLAPESRTEEQGFALEQSDRLVEELLQADTLVIGAPMLNFNIPSVLKLWLDHVIRPGRTVSFEQGAPKGMLKAQKAIVIISSGGEYVSTPHARSLDFETPYLQFILRMLGVSELLFLHVGGTDSVKKGKTSLGAFAEPWCAKAREFAVQAGTQGSMIRELAGGFA